MGPTRRGSPPTPPRTATPPGPRTGRRSRSRAIARASSVTTRITPIATSGPHSASSRWASRAVRRTGSCRAWLPMSAAMARTSMSPTGLRSGARVAYELIWQSWCDEDWYHVVAATGPAGRSWSNSSQSALRSGRHGRPTEREVAFVERLSNLQAANVQSGARRTIATPFRWPSWQPIPVNGYPRPAGASPTEVVARAGLPALQLAQPHTRSAAGIRLLQPAHPAARPAHGRHPGCKRAGGQEPQQPAHRPPARATPRDRPTRPT